VLIEDLIRLGRPLLESDEFTPEDVLRLITGIEDPRVKNFYRHVFVVEIPTDENSSPRVLPMQRFGEVVHNGAKEDFQVALDQAAGAPLVLASGGNPLQPQGRYIPVYACYDRHIQAFRASPEGVKEFLVGRLERTVAFSLSPRMLDEVASAVHESIRATDFGDIKKVLGILILARCEPGGYFVRQPGGSFPSVGSAADGSSIVPSFGRILAGFWEAKLEEGKEAGSRSGPCSFSGAEGPLVSAYCKSWPWALPTWTCPLPLGGDESMLIESVALSHDTYRALTQGACVFNRLTRPLSAFITPELFSPADTRAGKDQAKRRRGLPSIHGSGFLLPIEDHTLTAPHEKAKFVAGVRGMLKDKFDDPTMADRYMEAVTGFDFMLPPGEGDDYRLTLVYFSGDFSRGDIHLRASIQDVIPSTLRSLRELAFAEAKQSMKLLRALMPGMSQKQEAYFDRCFKSVPYLLVRAYGGAYLWQQLEAALHRRRLDPRRAVANAARRMQSLTPRWPESRRDLSDEVGFYLSFLSFLTRTNRELAGLDEDPPMRAWKELLHQIEHQPVAELQLTDPADIGFACGALLKRFSRSYYRAMKASKPNPDFLKDRVLTFGSDLRVSAVHDKGLRSIIELPGKLKNLNRSRELEERAGAVISAFQGAHERINRAKDEFLTAFWSGYALQGYERLPKVKTCPHCGKPLERAAKSLA
jgi:hypothetical protein